jgi:hypothetical protein
MMAAGNAVYSELKNLIVWVKTNGGMGSFYRSQHELIFVWKSGTAPTSTTSNSANTVGAARTSGSTTASAPSAQGGVSNSPGIRPSSLLIWWQVHCRIAPVATESSWIRSLAQEPSLLQPNKPGAAPAARKSILASSMLQLSAGRASRENQTFKDIEEQRAEEPKSAVDHPAVQLDREAA